jgi:scyllo-inositol 2-dehydrogenase (NADP+)
VSGWNVRYTTELTQPVWFYVRGEEYSAQIDHFVQCINTGASALSNFRTASDTSLVASAIRTDAAKVRTAVAPGAHPSEQTEAIKPRRHGAQSFIRALFGRP